MVQDRLCKNIFEWHPIDHMPLLKDGIISVSKKETGYVALKDCIFITPSFVIMNYNYQKITEQHLYKEPELHLKILKHLFDYIDNNRMQIEKYKNQIFTLTQKVKVNNIFLLVSAHIVELITELYFNHRKFKMQI